MRLQTIRCVARQCAAVAAVLAAIVVSIQIAYPCSGGVPAPVPATPAASAPAPLEPGIAKLLADLDHDQFTIREQASAELAKLGKSVVPALRQALTAQVSPEVRQRVERALQTLGEPAVAPAPKPRATYNAYTGCGTYSGRVAAPAPPAPAAPLPQPGAERR